MTEVSAVGMDRTGGITLIQNSHKFLVRRPSQLHTLGVCQHLTDVLSPRHLTLQCKFGADP